MEQQQPMKMCKTCEPQQLLHIDAFHKSNKGSFGRQNSCKECQAKAKAARDEKLGKAGRKSWRERNIDKVRAMEHRKHIRAKYGITPEQYDLLLKSQNSVCAICENPPGTHHLAVDHDHETGLVRGLLCRPCNAFLGLMDEDPERIRRAASYLESMGLFRRAQ